MAYEQSMQRILLESLERRSLVLAALSWIYHARRPLTISELLQALAINPAARWLSEEDRVSSKRPWHFAVKNGAKSVIALLCPVV